MDLRHSPAVQPLSSASGSAEKSIRQDRSHKPCMKQMGERSGEIRMLSFDVEGPGNVAWSR